MALTYPLPLGRKNNLEEWLNTLPHITASNTPNVALRICACCSTSAPFNERAFVDESDGMVLSLPCGCCWHRLCLTDLLSLDAENDDHCLRCGFQVFEQWSLDAWIDTLERISVEELSKREIENECGVCKSEYKAPESAEDKPEQPIVLPCKHTFGESCLRQWLSPTDGKGNTCPTCRRKLFPSWPSDDQVPDEDIEEIDLNGFGLQVEPNDDEIRAMYRRLEEERTHWRRFIMVHQRIHGLSIQDQRADCDWMDERIREMDSSYLDWVNETRWQRGERRARIREMLLDRVLHRARVRCQLTHVEMEEIEEMEERARERSELAHAEMSHLE